MKHHFEYEDPKSGEILFFDIEYEVSLGAPEKLTGHPDTWEPAEGDDIDIQEVTPTEEENPCFARIWGHLKALSQEAEERGDVVEAKRILQPVVDIESAVIKQLFSASSDTLVQNYRDYLEDRHAEDKYEAYRNHMDED